MSSGDANLSRCQSSVLAICADALGRSGPAGTAKYSAARLLRRARLEFALKSGLSTVCGDGAQATGWLRLFQSTDPPADAVLPQEARQNATERQD